MSVHLSILSILFHLYFMHIWGVRVEMKKTIARVYLKFQKVKLHTFTVLAENTVVVLWATGTNMHWTDSGYNVTCLTRHTISF